MRNFLGCTETLTLVHHEQTPDGDLYSCYPIHGASWYEKMETAVSTDGAKPVNMVKVRIPEAALPAVLPCKLDYMVKGQVANITRPADLKGQIYFQITALADNRRGNLSHFMISGV